MSLETRRIPPYDLSSAVPERYVVLTLILICISIMVMTRPRRITANLPQDLLDDAMEATGKGITETLIEGLRLVRRSRLYAKAMSMRGKVHLKVDVSEARERRRR